MCSLTLDFTFVTVDHSGVPNAQLVKEHTSLATAYSNKSVAEQNSVDLAWDLLMEDCYKDLRRTIYCNEVEFKRFRQLVVNTVLVSFSDCRRPDFFLYSDTMPSLPRFTGN